MGVIRAVEVEHGQTHQRNESKHVEDGKHDIEVCVHTVAQSQEWLVLKLSLTLGHSNLQFLQQCFSECVSEIRLAGFSALSEWLQESQDVVQLG